MTNHWRPVVAALANSDARHVYAEAVLGLPDSGVLPMVKRERAVEVLRAAGLIEVDSGGHHRATSEGLRALLAEGAEPKREGVDRFIRDGRIEQYPARPSDRRAVLEWVARELLSPGEELSEAEVNERLARHHDDVASLRRYLVDAGLLQRTPSGDSYRRSEQACARLGLLVEFLEKRDLHAAGRLQTRIE